MTINPSKVRQFFNDLYIYSALGGVLLSAVLVIASCASSADSTVEYDDEEAYRMALLGSQEGGVIPGGVIPTTADGFTKRGIEFLEKGDYKEAIEDFDQALELDFNHVQAYIKRGIAYRNRRDRDKALQDFNDALMLDPNNAEAYYERGVLYSQSGFSQYKDEARNNEYNKAIEDFTAAIQNNPKYADAYYQRGLAYYNKASVSVWLQRSYTFSADTTTAAPTAEDQQRDKDYDKAIADFTAAIQINPNDAEAYSKRGDVYLQKKDWDKIIADFTAAIQINPNDAEAYSKRGDAYLKKGDYDKAIADYNKAIPYLAGNDRANAYSSRGDAYLAKGSYKQAMEDFDQAIKDYDINKRTAVSKKRDNAITKAIAAYTEALRINPKDAEAYNNRGEMYLAKGNRNAAIEDFTQARQLDTSNQTYRANLDKARGR